MADLLLDAAVLQDYRREGPGARAVIERVIIGEVTASASPLTVFELWSAGDLDRRAEIGLVGVLSFLEEAPLSIEAAKTAGVWLASVEEPERAALWRYALVAATAQERGEPVCTREQESYARFYSELVSY